MERGSTIFLKAVIFLIGLIIFALCIFLVPEMAKYMGHLYPEMAY